MIRFQKSYFFLSLLLFITEILIAVFVHDKFIRPYVGDFLVVILIYCFVKAWIDAPFRALALAVLLFAYTIEVLQYFNLVKRLGLQQSRLANIIIGNSFAWSDMIAYTLGILLVVLLERRNRIPTPSSNSSPG
jgi:hypothetical protein